MIKKTIYIGFYVLATYYAIWCSSGTQDVWNAVAFILSALLSQGSRKGQKKYTQFQPFKSVYTPNVVDELLEVPQKSKVTGNTLN